MSDLVKLSEVDGTLPEVLARYDKAWAEHPHRLSEREVDFLARLNKELATAYIAGRTVDRLEVSPEDFELLVDVLGRMPGFDGEMVDGVWLDDISKPIALNERLMRSDLFEQGIVNILYRGHVVVSK